MKISQLLLWAALLLMPGALRAESGAGRVDSFTPAGTVKQVRQVKARFSESMVPFGDLRDTAAPFAISCPEPGTARWVDDRNWVYDFDRDLPAGTRCEFTLRAELRTLAGGEITGPRAYSFSTGGPAILFSNPYEGGDIAEDQIFILQLDADAAAASVSENVYFAVDGIASRVAASIVTGPERDAIIKSVYRYYDTLPEHLLLVRARQRFPADTRVNLVWGRGVASLSGVATEQDQTLPFRTRPVFAARFSCERENPQAACVPVSPLRLEFTAAVSAKDAARARLTGPDGQPRRPQPIAEGNNDAYTNFVEFAGPFPALTEFTVTLPSGLKDDAGRALTNAAEFPLKVSTADYPPLAKFAASFGILELKASPVLPVTLRNVEAQVAARRLDIAGQPGAAASAPVQGNVTGKALRVASPSSVEDMLLWLRKVRVRSWSDRGVSVFAINKKAAAKTAKTAKPQPDVQSFTIPKPEGAKAFEVVGIPLEKPGFYVVELESEILGAALLGKPAPMYVATTALVTNLSVHFKWGDESSLVWVTALDDARPVSGAAVQVRDCTGAVRWEGRTGADGVARAGRLPKNGNDVPSCTDANGNWSTGLTVTASTGDDMAFALTEWNEGIEPWRFQLPTAWNPDPRQVHTVFDRTLFRPGETAHMKHILRRRVMTGFAELPRREVKNTATLIHEGSEQKYEIPLRWLPDQSAESEWAIPADARLGTYYVYFYDAAKTAADEYTARIPAGSFRVEEYRVPLMRALLRAPAEPLVAPDKVPVDLTVTYLAGGGAGRLPVKFRYLVSPRYAGAPAAYEGFTFSGEKVKEGVRRSEDEEAGNAASAAAAEVKSRELTLNALGSLRTEIDDLPRLTGPMNILAELDFKDPNGETQTASTNIPLWASARRVGVKPDNWALSREALKFQTVVLDLDGHPVADAPVEVKLFEQKTYSHRKRLVGGFYAYGHSTETRLVQTFCNGKTDARGLLPCEGPVAVAGNLILEATTRDDAGREAVATTSVWVAGERDWWFAATDSDRMDVLPEARRYEPGETARLQVRMPFRQATALVTVEREGVAETFVRELSGQEPVIELPIKAEWAPNVFISVLAVRGRAGEVQPTATVDLGRPAFRLGIAEIQVGWQAHELQVLVTPERPVYKVREKARAKIAVTTADGTPLPAGSEVAVAAVDEGLLELMPNESWNLLGAMMGRRAYGVRTYTAQMQVIGKRHFGLKALPTGGGGGQGMTRELFDTLLFWKSYVKLDARGEAEVEIPLNDSLTSFRVVAIATGALDRFGSGSASIRTTQDLILFSGVPPLVRTGDRFAATFTARNATEREMRVRLNLRVTALVSQPEPREISLAAGESREVGFDLTAPAGVTELRYTLEAVTVGDGNGSAAATDRLAVTQQVAPAVPVRVLQATLAQLEQEYSLPVERPADALPGEGGLRVAFQARLGDTLDGVTRYMSEYPYNCLEQQASRAVALGDEGAWKSLMARLPAYLDGDGLVKYFPVMWRGDDVLTAYLLAVAHEAGWNIPEDSRNQMVTGLQNFVAGRVTRAGALPTADLVIRKLAAIEALSRSGKAKPDLLSSITIEPNLWPTSAVIDWLNILTRLTAYPQRAERLAEAQQILRTRLNLQGTTMGFSTAASDRLWWLMVSIDANAARLLLAALDNEEWRAGWSEDMPRLARGLLGRQQHGHWDTTTANAWGRLALQKFSAAFESVPVTGESRATLAGETKTVSWRDQPAGGLLLFPWPGAGAGTGGRLAVTMNGTGKPWLIAQSLAAVPLREPISSGYKITRTLTPVEQKVKGVWSAGDIVRVRIEITAQADMTWVVLSDPIPAGATILGSGLGRDSVLSTRGEKRGGEAGGLWPVFEERSFAAYREYYDFTPRGSWSTEYTLRLGSAGRFQLPPTRVEAMYAPEMFGELPLDNIEVR